MIWLGIGLMLVGFVTAAPRGGTAGGAAHRNVPLGGVGGLVSTPGYQGDDSDTSRRNKVIRILMGVVLLAAGLVVIIVAG